MQDTKVELFNNNASKFCMESQKLFDIAGKQRNICRQRNDSDDANLGSTSYVQKICAQKRSKIFDKMASVLREVCDSSPAKRAKLEFENFQHHPMNIENVSGGRDLANMEISGEEMNFTVGNKEALPMHARVLERNAGISEVDPGGRQSQHELVSNSTDELSTASMAFEGGVSSSSDNMSECYNGGDSGFNELASHSSEFLGLSLQDGKKEVQEADSSVTSCMREFDETSFFDYDDKDDVASTISHLSGLSDWSDVSGQDWKPIAGPMGWVQRQMQTGTNPRTLLQDLMPPETHIPQHLDDIMLWKIILNMLSEPPCRKKLADVNTIEDVVRLIRSSKNIIVLTGAGVSVSCGIPDFRSKNGVYARLAKDFPDLPDPQAMFDINYFRKDPRPFYKFAKEIYPGQFQPSPSHKFIKLLEDHGKLLRNYSQNIDTLEQIAGIRRIIECHGSFATASCTKCGHKTEASSIRDEIFQQKIPHCSMCKAEEDELAVMKPDIVFFGEGLPEEFHSTMAKDKDQCDLLIVIGSSLKVRPVALIPNSLPEHVPQILINREPLQHLNFDVELLGDCDGIINELCLRLGDGWKQITFTGRLKEIQELSSNITDDSPASMTVEKPSNSVQKGTIHPLQRHSSVFNDSPSEASCSYRQRDIQCDSTSDRSLKEADSSSGRLDSQNLLREDNILFSGVKKLIQNSDPDSTSEHDHSEPVSENDIEALRACWKPKMRENIADRIPAGTYLFVPPNRYIFSGAEVFFDPEQENLNEMKSVVDSDSEETGSTNSIDCSIVSDENEERNKEETFFDEPTGNGDDSGVGDMKIDQCVNTDENLSNVNEQSSLQWTSSSS